MNDKKNLDRLFQEKFKDFEAEPREQVWKNIESSLKLKNEKKEIPLWRRLSGVAAALIIGAVIFNSVFNDSIKLENQTVTKESPNATDSQINVERNGIATGKANPEATANESVINNSADSSSGVNKTGSNTTNNKNNPVNSGAIVKASDEKHQKSVIKGSKFIVKPEEGVASQSSKNNKRRNKNLETQNNENSVAEKSASVSRQEMLERRKNSIRKNTIESAVAASGKKGKNNKNRNKSEILSADNINKTGTTSVSETVIAASVDKNSKTAGDVNGSENTFKNQNSSITNNQKNEQNEIIKTSTDNTFRAAREAVIAEKTVEQKLDSTAIATVEPINALEELLKENEKEKKMIAETKVNRWQITSNVAPIYFGSASKGSPIDEQFSGNDKTYDNNLSFGVGVNYAVNKKFNIRAGVNKLTLGYNTNNVLFYAGLGSKNFDNITPTGNATFIEVISSAAAAELLPFENSLQNTKLGYITQTMGYIEVPMEMSYKIVDNKFGVTVIGGLSTLFLNDNEVRITSTDLTASLGKANNLNDLHFSSNIGMGFKYSFLKNFQFNFEPMFKYQINTFTKKDGNFKPYFFGLYSGVSFNF